MQKQAIIFVLVKLVMYLIWKERVFRVKKWLTVVRAQFLLLSVALGFLGGSIAWYASKEFGTPFSLGDAFLAFLGILLLHISTNVLNDYYDYRSGIDLRTTRTPFSGGSGALPENLIKPKQALWLGISCLAATIPIGIYYLIARGWLLLPLLLVAAFCVVLYSPLILKRAWPEWSPGLGLGILPIIGIYFAQTGEYFLPVIIGSIPAGILVHNLLLLNEFPDTEADASGGRKTMPISIGKNKSAVIYSILTIMVYLWIIGGVIAGQMPVFALIGLITLPLAVKAIRGALNHKDISKLIPGMANNVMVVLLTQVFMGVGYILAGAL